MTIKYNIWRAGKQFFFASDKYKFKVVTNISKGLEKSEADLICADLNAFIQEQDKALTAKIASIKKLLESRSKVKAINTLLELDDYILSEYKKDKDNNIKAHITPNLYQLMCSKQDFLGCWDITKDKILFKGVELIITTKRI